MLRMTDPAPNHDAQSPRLGLGPEDRIFCLRLARETIRCVTNGSQLPSPTSEQLSAPLLADRACFVTLHISGHLRGCIGQTIATKPLYESIISSAEGAAMRDPRFPQVQPGEVDQLQIEISVLTTPTPIHADSPEHLLELIEPGRHGVLFRLSGITSTFLPQVWHELPDKVMFMERLARKAGFGPNAWRDSQAEIAVYEVESFEEAQSGSYFI
jgi:AmmeMemoRadiSam system protein A